MKSKKILYVDMDNVLVDFPYGLGCIEAEVLNEYVGRHDEIPGLFAHMPPLPDALESYKKLSGWFDTYILSTAPWGNPSAWQDKLLWVQKYMGELAHKRLILTHNKHLNQGDFLVDDRPNNGAEHFRGEWIHFLSPRFPDWKRVVAYLEERR